jgi:hypothetical protein
VDVYRPDEKWWPEIVALVFACVYAVLISVYYVFTGTVWASFGDSGVRPITIAPSPDKKKSLAEPHKDAAARGGPVPMQALPVRAPPQAGLTPMTVRGREMFPAFDEAQEDRREAGPSYNPNYTGAAKSGASASGNAGASPSSKGGASGARYLHNAAYDDVDDFDDLIAALQLPGDAGASSMSASALTPTSKRPLSLSWGDPTLDESTVSYNPVGRAAAAAATGTEEEDDDVDDGGVHGAGQDGGYLYLEGMNESTDTLNQLGSSNFELRKIAIADTHL